MRPKTEKFSLHFFDVARPNFFQKGKENFLFWIFAKSKKAEAEHFKFFSFYTFGRHRPTQPNAGDSMEFPNLEKEYMIKYRMEVKEMRRNSSFVRSALSFEKTRIFGDIEDICPTDKISNHLGQSKINFKRISNASGLLAKRLILSFKAQ